MPKAGEIAVLALATWRLSELLGAERGPFAIFPAIRHLAGLNHDGHGRPQMTNPDSELQIWFTCPKCRTVILAGGLVLAWRWRWGKLAAWMLAASAGALLLGGIVSEDNQDGQGNH